MAMAIIAAIAAQVAIYQNRNRQDTELEPFPTVTNLEKYTTNIQLMNRGGMRSFQTDIDDLETQCLVKTDASNVEIANMFD